MAKIEFVSAKKLFEEWFNSKKVVKEGFRQFGEGGLYVKNEGDYKSEYQAMREAYIAGFKQGQEG